MRKKRGWRHLGQGLINIDGDFLLTCFLFCILYLNKIKR